MPKAIVDGGLGDVKTMSLSSIRSFAISARMTSARGQRDHVPLPAFIPGPEMVHIRLLPRKPVNGSVPIDPASELVATFPRLDRSVVCTTPVRRSLGIEARDAAQESKVTPAIASGDELPLLEVRNLCKGETDRTVTIAPLHQEVEKANELARWIPMLVVFGPLLQEGLDQSNWATVCG
jgi:hypothetical protein